MPISAILLYGQVRGDFKRLPRTFFFPSIRLPAEVYKAVRRIYRAIYTYTLYTGRACACVPSALGAVSAAPCQVPSRIIRGKRARNTYVLAHSSRETLYSRVDALTRASIRAHAHSPLTFLLFPLRSPSESSSIYKPVTNEP